MYLLFRRPLFSALFIFILAVQISSCNSESKITKREVAYVKLDSAYKNKEDTSIAHFVNSYSQSLYKEMNEVLVISDIALTKDQPESLLGNVFSDIVFEAVLNKYSKDELLKPDLCLFNNGGLRSSLPKGEITRGKIYELMPFENEVVVVTISGAAMKDLTQYVASAGGVPVANLKMGIKTNKPVDVFVGGKSLDLSKNYNIVTSDYLSGGGDKMTFFNNPIKITYTKLKLRDVLIEHMKELKKNNITLTAAFDKRVYYVK